MCFICEDNSVPRGSIATQHRCNLCPSLALTVKSPGKLVEHMAQHVLFDREVLTRQSPCGFCCLGGNSCVVFLSKGRGAKASQTVDMAKTRCKNGNAVKLSMKTAKVSTASSPCSNVPINCPLCPSGSAAVWKYNLEGHLVDVHPMSNKDEHKHLYSLAPLERGALKSPGQRLLVGPLGSSATLERSKFPRHIRHV